MLNARRPPALIPRGVLLGAALGAALALSSRPAAAGERDAAAEAVEIHLITIGPGEPVLTAGGHTALMVARLRDGRPDPAGTLVYNFGDADFDDPALPLRFLRGEAEFRLAVAGSLQEVVDNYGVRQGREVWRQRLQLTPEEARLVAERLALDAEPERRNYRYHHSEATCTTKVRDLLDEATGGALTRSLAGKPATPPTAREVQRSLFRRHHLVAIGGDLVFGRLHDRPVDKLWALVDPPRMSELLQEVMVPAPGGAGMVPLAEPPAPLIEFVGARAPELPSITTPLVTIFMILGIGLGGRLAARALPADRLGAGLLLLVYPLISGLIGALMIFILAYSGIPELRENENVLVFPVTDLLLVGLGAALLRGPLSRRGSALLLAYARARLGLVALLIVLHLVGVLYQEPRLFVALSAAFSVALWWIAARLAPLRGSPAAPTSSGSPAGRTPPA